jgi:hypothetical protein
MGWTASENKSLKILECDCSMLRDEMSAIAQELR